MNVEETNTALLALLTEHGITYQPRFVPKSMSRNRLEKALSLNWFAEFIAPKKDIFSVEYSQGIGHIPKALLGGNPPRSGTIGREAIETRIAESGKGLPKPTVADILHCIVIDNCSEHHDFEDWADSFGYDKDSRKAETIYRACVQQTRDAERFFGRALIAKFAELLQDY